MEVAEPRVEHALLAVASGAGLALLPESATERYTAPGVRFVPVEGIEAAFESVVITHRDSENLADGGIPAFKLSRAAGPHRRLSASRPALSLAA